MPDVVELGTERDTDVLDAKRFPGMATENSNYLGLSTFWKKHLFLVSQNFCTSTFAF